MNGAYLDGRQIRLDSATQRDRTNQGGGNRQGGAGGPPRGGNQGNSSVFLSQDDKNAKKGAIAGYQGKKVLLWYSNTCYLF